MFIVTWRKTHTVYTFTDSEKRARIISTTFCISTFFRMFCLETSTGRSLLRAGDIKLHRPIYLVDCDEFVALLQPETLKKRHFLSYAILRTHRPPLKLNKCVTFPQSHKTRWNILFLSINFAFARSAHTRYLLVHTNRIYQIKPPLWNFRNSFSVGPVFNN